MQVLSCLSFTLNYLSFFSMEITPPPTPSPVKAAGGRKRAMGDCESDDNDVFVPRYVMLYFKILFFSDKFHLLVLPGTAQKRHALKSLRVL